MYNIAQRATVEAMAEGKDKLRIRLHVYDTDIPVNIRREDEFYYREAAKLISNTVNTYADRYKSRNSDKEIMYMAMIDIALRLQRQKGDSDTSELDKILSALTSEIDGIL
jgi:cell division protein ZapA